MFYSEFHVADNLITHQPQAQGSATLEGGSHRWLLAYVSFKRPYSAAHDLESINLMISRTIQTAVLIETLVALGAEVTWSSCVSFFLMRWLDESLSADDHGRTSIPRKIMLPLRT